MSQSDCWFESNWAQRGWQTAGEKYVCKFKGNTLVDIAPGPATITDGLGYPLYRREQMKAHEAHMKTVKRFVMETHRRPASRDHPVKFTAGRALRSRRRSPWPPGRVDVIQSLPRMTARMTRITHSGARRAMLR